MRGVVWTALALAACLPGAGRGPDQAVFRYRLEPGTRESYRVHGTAKGAIGPPSARGPTTGREVPFHLEWQFDLEQEALEWDEESERGLLALHIPRLRAGLRQAGAGTRVSLTSQGLRVHRGSSESGEPRALPDDLALLSRPLEMSLTATGELSDRSPRAVHELPAPLALVPLDVRQWFVQFPRRLVRRGDAWQQERTLNPASSSPPRTVQALYRWDGWEEACDVRCARIVIAAVLDDAGGDAGQGGERPASLQAFPQTPAAYRLLDWGARGRCWFNLEAGRIERLEWERSSLAEVRLLAPGGETTFRARMTTTTTMERAGRSPPQAP